MILDLLLFLCFAKELLVLKKVSERDGGIYTTLTTALNAFVWDINLLFLFSLSWMSTL